MSHNSELSPNTSGVTPKKRSTKAVETRKNQHPNPASPVMPYPLLLLAMFAMD
nr:hypothetical protein [Shewanella sp. POL2]